MKWEFRSFISEGARNGNENGNETCDSFYVCFFFFKMSEDFSFILEGGRGFNMCFAFPFLLKFESRVFEISSVVYLRKCVVLFCFCNQKKILSCVCVCVLFFGFVCVCCAFCP